MSHIPQKFPGWRYHRELPPRIVNDPEEEMALGPGWAEEPSFADSGSQTETEPTPDGAAAASSSARCACGKYTLKYAAKVEHECPEVEQ